ncbi:MAG: SDR family oxidoreductase [Candidatus Margulisiibacteriota bacterium]
MKILITGCNGFLGANLVEYFMGRGYTVCGTDLHPVPYRLDLSYMPGDLSDPQFTAMLIDKFNPECVINTIALVNLDLCENDKDKAYRVNVATTANLASILNNSVRLVQISTDHLFAGDRSNYNENDPPNPVNNYGLTKLEAENEALKHNNTIVARTNFYGWSRSLHAPTFAEWLYNSLKDKTPITLFANYYFTPIEVTYLAGALESVINSDTTGVLNIVGTQRCSKYEFGMKMAEVFGLDSSNVTAGKIDNSSLETRRQADLSLSVEKFQCLFDYKLPDMIEGLKRLKENLKKNA